jgi:adenylate cyclase, class 2
METEIEAKFPGIDAEALRAKLFELGATLVYSEVLMRRKVFDYPNDLLEEKGGWVRVRDEGDQITLSYKQMNDRTLHGTKEVTVTVNDFDKTCDFLIELGLQVISYQETKREKWLYNDVEITLDTWPWVPSFVELESLDEEKLRAVAVELEFDWNDAMHGSVETVYQMHYDFTEREINRWPEIVFIDPPEWLMARKK